MKFLQLEQLYQIGVAGQLFFTNSTGTGFYSAGFIGLEKLYFTYTI